MEISGQRNLWEKLVQVEAKLLSHKDFLTFIALGNNFDRQLATRMGVKAVDTAESGDWGQMTAYKDFRVQPVPLADAVDRLKTVPEALYRVAEVFFG